MTKQKPLSKRMSAKDVLRRNELMAAITSKLEDFLTCAVHFWEIRDSQLFRETHDDFVSFCEENWNLSTAHVNRMISAASVAATMTQPPDNERQLRELTSVPKEDRDDVIEEARANAKEEKREVTAKDVAKAAAKKKANVQPAEPTGPDDALACRSMFNGLSQSLGHMLTKFDDVAQSEGGAYLRDRGTVRVRQRFEAAIKEAQAVVQSCKPDAVCPRCGGEGILDKLVCPICEGNGYITKQQGG